MATSPTWPLARFEPPRCGTGQGRTTSDREPPRRPQSVRPQRAKRSLPSEATDANAATVSGAAESSGAIIRARRAPIDASGIVTRQSAAAEVARVPAVASAERGLVAVRIAPSGAASAWRSRHAAITRRVFGARPVAVERLGGRAVRCRDMVHGRVRVASRWANVVAGTPVVDSRKDAVRRLRAYRRAAACRSATGADAATRRRSAS